MIKRLKIKNFKSHKETELTVSNLNILCGLNGSGKSSILQSLLLLRQSNEINRLLDGLVLNDSYCQIGTSNDALYYKAQEDNIIFEMETTEVNFLQWTYEWEKNKTFIPIKYFKNVANVLFREISLFNERFQYISAARLGPQAFYTEDNFAVETQRRLSIERGKGELTAHFLHYFQNEKIKFDYLKHSASEWPELIRQVSAWEREISPNVNVRVYEEGNAYRLKYAFDVKAGETPPDAFSAENVGFGLTYVLPIIVAALSSEEDSLLLIENPEAHLHPQGQAKLAELLAMAAQCGVQIWLETHSDHIINGTLVAIKKKLSGEKGIDPEKVRIFYFDRDETDHSTRTTPVPISPENGRIMDPPDGFFDQIEKDLGFILGL